MMYWRFAARWVLSPPHQLQQLFRCNMYSFQTIFALQSYGCDKDKDICEGKIKLIVGKVELIEFDRTGGGATPC